MTPARTICLGFLTLICIGTLLLMLPYTTADGQAKSFLIAFFTATSAVCVNGFTIVDIESHFSIFGQIILLFLIQLGGLGYMTSSSFLILVLGGKLGMKQRFNMGESLTFEPGKSNDLRKIIKRIIKVALVIEGIGILALFTVFIRDFDFINAVWLSVFHGISAFTRSGFSLFPDSFESYQPIGLYIIIPVLVILGGIGYPVIRDLYVNFKQKMKSQQTELTMHTKVVLIMTGALLVVGVIGFYFLGDVGTGASVQKRLFTAWFESAASVSAGFSNTSHMSFSTGSLFLTIILMFIGAAPGGTGGGIKITTVWILLMAVRAVIKGQTRVISFGREIPLENILKAIALAVGSVAAIVVFSFSIAFFDGHIDFMYILHEVVSSYGTVGQSFGITGELSEPSLYVLITSMYVGRINVLLIIAALLGGDKTSYVRYPTGRLLVE